MAIRVSPSQVYETTTAVSQFYSHRSSKALVSSKGERNVDYAANHSANVINRTSTNTSLFLRNIRPFSEFQRARRETQIEKITSLGCKYYSWIWIVYSDSSASRQEDP